MNNSKASRAVFELAAAQLQQEGHKFGVDVNIQITDAPTSTEDGFHISKETMERFGLKTRPRGSFVDNYPDNLYADEVRHPQPAGAKFSDASRKLKEADDTARAARAAYDEAAREIEARTEMFHAAAGSDPRIAKNTPAWFNSVEGREEVFVINPEFDVEISVRPVIGGAPASLRYAVLMAKTSGFVVEFQSPRDWKVTNVPIEVWQRHLMESGQVAQVPSLYQVMDFVRYDESVPEGERLVSTDGRADQFGRVHFDLLKTGTITFIPRRYSHPRSFGVLSALNKGRLGVQINFHGLDVPSSEVVRYMEAVSMAVQTGFKVEVTEHKLNLTNHELIIPRGEEGNLRDYILIHSEGKWLHPDAITSIYNATVAPIPFSNPRLQPVRAYGESELRDSMLFDQGQRASYLDPDKAAFILDQVQSFGPRGFGDIDASLFRAPISRGYMEGVRRLRENLLSESTHRGDADTALGRLFIAICQNQGIDKAKLTSRVSEYLLHRYPSRHEYLSARSNMLKELQRDTMTWKTFCKGLEAIGMNAFTLSAGVSQVNVDLTGPFVVGRDSVSPEYVTRKHVHDSRTDFSQRSMAYADPKNYVFKDFAYEGIIDILDKDLRDTLKDAILKAKNTGYVVAIEGPGVFHMTEQLVYTNGNNASGKSVDRTCGQQYVGDYVRFLNNDAVKAWFENEDGVTTLADLRITFVAPEEKFATTGPGLSEEGFLKAEGAVVIDWPEGLDEEQRALITNAVLVAHDRDRQVILNVDGSILVPGSFSGFDKSTVAGATNLWQFVIFAGGMGAGPLQRITPAQLFAINRAQVRFDLTPEELELAQAVKRRGTVIDTDEEFTMREVAHPVVDSTVAGAVLIDPPAISADAKQVVLRGILSAVNTNHCVMIDSLFESWVVTKVDLATRLNTVLHQADYPRKEGVHYVDDFIVFDGDTSWLGDQEMVNRLCQTEVQFMRKEEVSLSQELIGKYGVPPVSAAKEECAQVENTESGDSVAEKPTEFVAEPDGDPTQEGVLVFEPMDHDERGNVPYTAKVSVDGLEVGLGNVAVELPKELEFALRVARAEGRYVRVVSSGRIIVTRAPVKQVTQGNMYGSDYLGFDAGVEYKEFPLDDFLNGVITWTAAQQ